MNPCISVSIPMRLVIDANIVFSALIAAQKDTFRLLFDPRLRLFAPQFLMEEIAGHIDLIEKKSGLPRRTLLMFIDVVSSVIQSIPQREYAGFLDFARAITPDPRDVDYLALALHLDCPVWSHDKGLKLQTQVGIISTGMLLKMV
ncbi:MAG: PIN domain-containing protein [Nanoarchaeota archaeon]